jgi:hypothetical protein
MSGSNPSESAGHTFETGNKEVGSSPAGARRPGTSPHVRAGELRISQIRLTAISETQQAEAVSALTELLYQHLRRQNSQETRADGSGENTDGY